MSRNLSTQKARGSETQGHHDLEDSLGYISLFKKTYRDKNSKILANFLILFGKN